VVVVCLDFFIVYNLLSLVGGFWILKPVTGSLTATGFYRGGHFFPDRFLDLSNRVSLLCLVIFGKSYFCAEGSLFYWNSGGKQV
jgi:hypothetical protein